MTASHNPERRPLAAAPRKVKLKSPVFPYQNCGAPSARGSYERELLDSRAVGIRGSDPRTAALHPLAVHASPSRRSESAGLLPPEPAIRPIRLLTVFVIAVRNPQCGGPFQGVFLGFFVGTAFATKSGMDVV